MELVPENTELVLENIHFSYDKGLPTERIVLDSLSLKVRGGELLSIVGRTGSGKTTLGLIMAELLAPTRGRVVPPVNRGAKGADVVMVFQFPESQFFEEDVFSEVAFGPSRLGLRREEIRQSVTSAMEKMKLDSHALSSRSTLSLSEGEKRKVAIASGLACGPRFLILDEPTVSLDWEASVHIFEVLNELKQNGVSVIVMTHEVEDALAYSDRIAVLAEGGLSASGRVASGRPSKDEVYRILSQGKGRLSS
jgi:energy-coupling factor transport system ATP-binding protein